MPLIYHTQSRRADKIKQKIVLFDGDQTRFIYTKPSKKKILIQGLSGTGKTELLLHKLRDLYTASKENRIIFTCRAISFYPNPFCVYLLGLNSSQLLNAREQENDADA